MDLIWVGNPQNGYIFSMTNILLLVGAKTKCSFYCNFKKKKCIYIVPITVWSGACVLEVGSAVCGESDDEESTT